MWDLITQIEAQEMLKQFTVLDWPNMKRPARQSLHRDLHKQAYPVRKSITLDEYFKGLKDGK